MLVRIVTVLVSISLCNGSPMDVHNRTARAIVPLKNCEPRDMAHTIESYATSGKPCMNDCEEDYCYTASNVCESCTRGTKKAPIYYTSLAESPGHTQCVSKCGKFGVGYTWCYTDNYAGWDYCNADTDYRQTTVAFSEKYGPCESDCDYFGSSKTWCHTYWYDWDYCSPIKYTYNQVRTVTGKECRGECAKHDGSYYWCYSGLDGSREAEKCAAVAEYK